MALTAPSMFLYGFQVTELNRSLDFRSVMGGPELQATLTLGYYSLGSLMAEIERQLEATDPAHTYTVTANRSIAGGTQNRVTIATSSTYFDLLFSSGTRAASTVANLIGFTATDRTGFTTYTGTSTAGTRLVTNLVGYNWIEPQMMRRNFGSVNVAASGAKEAIVYSTQQFFQVQFKYIPDVTARAEWVPLMTWMMSQRLIEFTPEVNSYNIFYEATLETTAADGKGLAYTLTEMLPQFPFLRDTGLMRFRVRES